MIYIETESKDAAFHFSVEEYIVRHYPWGEPVMMIWRTDKCAMIGNNQIVEAEIDIGFARRHGIQIVRRLSGGGTIYTDPGALLYTVIQPLQADCDSQEIAREHVAGSVAAALNKMGVPAKIEGRNDILVDRKKVSGFAQYARCGRLCTHGSLLYDTDLEMLACVLRADEEKIRSKALRSIRSRVTNIIGYMDSPCSLTEFLGLLKKHLLSGAEVARYMLTDHDLTEINDIYYKQYGDPDWTFKSSPKFSFSNSKRFPGGKVEVNADVVSGVVNSCSIYGDFLGVSPIKDLETLFENKLFQYQAFTDVLRKVPLRPYLGSITQDEFLSCFFE